jgi:endogenous inhibitor of DNA gyrase (YacG/DUF329 family)
MKQDDDLPESKETGWTVYGPYLRKDGRKHVCLIKHNEDGSIAARRTKSYPKYLVELHLGRKLAADETIDHQDRDHTNDEIGNLIVRKKSAHSKLDAVYVTVEDVKCGICKKFFTPSVNQRNNYKDAGPFCSRKCKGRYGKSVQLTGVVSEREVINKTYYRADKDDHAILVEDKLKGRNYIFGTLKDAMDYTKEIGVGEKIVNGVFDSTDYVYNVLLSQKN